MSITDHCRKGVSEGRMYGRRTLADNWLQYTESQEGPYENINIRREEMRLCLEAIVHGVCLGWSASLSPQASAVNRGRRQIGRRCGCAGGKHSIQHTEIHAFTK